jgi:hypothetical protein
MEGGMPRPNPFRAGERALLNGLAGGSISSRELAVGGLPDTLNAATRADEKRGRSQGDERHQQRVLNQILSLIFDPKIAQKRHVDILREIFIGLSGRSATVLSFRDLSITAGYKSIVARPAWKTIVCVVQLGFY